MTGKKYANYEDDCKSYYICLYENLQKFDCNEGFLYNVNIDFCDWSENVQCKKETIENEEVSVEDPLEESTDDNEHVVLPSQPEIEIPNENKETTEKHESVSDNYKTNKKKSMGK